MGRYLMEDTKVGDWITRYSGDVMTKDEYDRRKHSQYRMQVHQNLFLDTVNPKHFEGRFINDARGSRYARFATGYTTNICSDTDYFWVRIYVTKKIKAGDEIFIDYGADFWAYQTPRGPRPATIQRPPPRPGGPPPRQHLLPYGLNLRQPPAQYPTLPHQRSTNDPMGTPGTSTITPSDTRP